MRATSSEKGNEGEETACRYLISCGYEILARNWRFKRLEVDIIAKKDNILVIIEVKSRKSGVFGEPELAVTNKKQGFLIAAAHHYITTRDIDAETRFDIVSVKGEGEACEVKHLEGAFFPVAK
jgi:putative endonuclease